MPIFFIVFILKTFDPKAFPIIISYYRNNKLKKIHDIRPYTCFDNNKSSLAGRPRHYTGVACTVVSFLERFSVLNITIIS